MAPEEYAETIRRWALTHKAAGKFFGCDSITSMRYATGKRKVPAPLAKLIRFMAQMEFTPEYVDRQVERWESGR